MKYSPSSAASVAGDAVNLHAVLEVAAGQAGLSDAAVPPLPHLLTERLDLGVGHTGTKEQAACEREGASR
ncbi:MAG: hypothetical protein QM804_15630 [Propionicimonas sp.]